MSLQWTLQGAAVPDTTSKNTLKKKIPRGTASLSYFISGVGLIQAMRTASAHLSHAAASHRKRFMYMNHLSSFLPQPCELCAILPIFQVKRLRLRQALSPSPKVRKEEAGPGRPRSPPWPWSGWSSRMPSRSFRPGRCFVSDSHSIRYCNSRWNPSYPCGILICV